MADFADQDAEKLQAQAGADVAAEQTVDDAPMLDDVESAPSAAQGAATEGAKVEENEDEAPFLTESAPASDALGEAAKALRAADEAAAAAKEREAKEPKKTTRSKSKKGPDLKKAPAKLEPKDPSEVPMRWYILQAFSGFELRVAQALQERIKIHHMEDYFGEVLVPKEKVKDMKDGKKRESERKFFPGYVMVQMKMTSDSWQLVKHTERVLGFIGGTPERPLPITEAEAAKILSRLRETADVPRPKTLFEVGESVRATEGAFKDFVGTVEKVDYEKNRLTVSIAIFGRATPVELEFSQVEKDV